jgi:hypothetical protein
MKKKRLHTDKTIDAKLLGNALKKIVSEDNFMEEQMGDTSVFVLEKYYIRNGSFASCTVCMNQNETGTDLAIFSSGAGYGWFNISMGATENFLEKAEEVIQKYL